MLPDVIARFRAARPGRRFFLQVQNATQAAAVSERIGHLDGLDIHTGQLSHCAYVSRLQTLEILLLPYMPDKTWMAYQLAAGRGAEVTFKDHTAESIAAARRDAWRAVECVGALLDRIIERVDRV